MQFLLTWNPDLTELNLGCPPCRLRKSSTHSWSREESWGLPWAFLSSFLYLHNSAENQDFSPRGSLQRAGWTAASCHLEIRLQPWNPDGHGQGTVVPAGSLGILEPDASSSSCSRQVVQGCCWSFELGFVGNSGIDVVFCWQTQPWFTSTLRGSWWRGRDFSRDKCYRGGRVKKEK